MAEDKKTKDAEKKGKKKETSEIVLERVYNVPLRREWLKVPRYMRAKKAGIALKQFIVKHMKSEDVKIGKFANLKIWEHGIKNPPHHIKIKAVKDNKGTVMVELEGVKLIEKVPSVLRKARAKAEKKPKKEKKKEEEPIDKKVEEAREKHQEEAKKIEKEEVTESKHQPGIIAKEEVMIMPDHYKEQKHNISEVRAPKTDQGFSRQEHRHKSERK